MTPTDYRALRERLGLSNAAAADLCGVEPRTAQRWQEGTREIPQPAQRLLMACERDPSLREWLAAR
jgi:DNA-binding transcriptional regulator YiaG